MHSKKSQTKLNKFFSVVPKKTSEVREVEEESSTIQTGVLLVNSSADNLNRPSGFLEAEIENDQDGITAGLAEHETMEETDLVASCSKSLDSLASSSGNRTRTCLLGFDLPEKPYQTENDLPSPQFHANQRVHFQAKWFSEFPWIHFQKSLDAVVCHVCATAVQKQLFKPGFKPEPAFTSTGFKSWRKARASFASHQSSSQHKEAVYAINPGVSIIASVSASTSDTFAKNKSALRLIISTLKFLGRQGLPLRGLGEEDGNFIELLKLRMQDYPALKDWLSRPKTYTSHDIQNEILRIMAHQILRKLTEKVREGVFFSLIVDETTDVSTKEQVSISVRHVSEDLIPEELFLGLYETTSTTGEALTSIILDVLKRFNLPVCNIRGQCYDGASNMKGKFSGVQTRILKEESRALYVHCFNHSLNLALQDVVKREPKMRDTLQYLNDVAVLFDRSMKRVELLKSFQDAAGKPSLRLKPLCQTRWCVRIASIKAMLKNYPEVLSSLITLSETNEPSSTTARGLLNQFEKAEIYLFILISRDVFEPCEELARTLQTPSASIHGTREAAQTVINHLEKLKSESHFEVLWKEMETDAENYELEKIKPPRKIKVPRRFCQSASEENSHDDVLPKKQLFKTYQNIVDSLINEIARRFTQSSTDQLMLLESVVCNLKADITSTQYKDILEKYDFDANSLKCQLSMFRDKHSEITSIDDAVKAFRLLHPDIQTLFADLKRFFKLLLVIPSSTASAERSFSMLRRLKTYLRATMTQNRLNHLAILHAYQNEVDDLDVDEVMKEFISSNTFRASQFGDV